MHLPGVADHAGMVREGIERLVRHYGGSPHIRLVAVSENRFPAWTDAIHSVLASASEWVIDITPGRTVPTIAAAEALRAHPDARALYLDVSGYRYEPEPFSWVPYNLQTVRMVIPGQKEESYQNVQFFGSYPNVPAMDVLGAGPKLDASGTRELLVPWEALVVLLNEAGAAAMGKRGAEGVKRFDIKLPHLGTTVGAYDMERSRLSMNDAHDVQTQMGEGLGFLSGAWGHDLPTYSDVLEALSAARILAYANGDELQRAIHSAAISTGGRREGRNVKWIGLDTNVFHLETLTTVARDRRIPLSRIPLVVSKVVHDELDNQMKATLPDGDPPQPIREAMIHRPRKARLAHLAHEEFDLLRHRSRMEIHAYSAIHRDSALNDQAIVDDMKHYADMTDAPVVFLSNDAACIQRAEAAGGRLHPIEIKFGNPATDLDEHPAIDKIAYFVYRLSLAFGRVSLKGLGVDVLGDHPDDEKDHYLHGLVRVRVPDKPWTRGFVHEVSVRGMLQEVVREAGVWL